MRTKTSKSASKISKINLIILTLGLGLSACSPKSQETLSGHGMNGIIDGEAVSETEILAKSTVYLEYRVFNDKNEPIDGGSCTGTLLAENLIVTAAHCVPKDDQKNYRFAVVFNRDLTAVQQSNVRAVRNFIAHPNYIDISTRKNEDPKAFQEKMKDGSFDIALVSFEGTIPEGYAPANILRDASLLTANMPVTVSGFGLVKSEGNIQEGTTFLRKGPAIFLGFVSDFEAILDQSKDNKGGTCSGDSGGPVTAMIDDVEYVWGVASRGGNPSDITRPCHGQVIYTNISSHNPFIELASELLIEDIQSLKGLQAAK